MLYINDLLELKNRDLFLEIKGEIYPMNLDFYITDDIFFFNTDKIKENKEISNLDNLRYFLELEAKNDTCWNDNLYIAPMNKIGNCEIRFPKNYKDDILKNDIFDNCYKITKMDITSNKIIIKLA